MRTLISANNLIQSVEKGLLRLAAVVMLFLMALVVIDIALRYLFNSPLQWSYDLISLYIVPTIFFLALSDTFRRNHHISVDLFYAQAPVAARRALRFVTTLLGIAVFALILVTAWGNAVEKYVNGDVIDGAILWPTWISSALAVAGTGLIVMRLVLDSLALARALLTGGATVPGESPARDQIGTAAGEP